VAPNHLGQCCNFKNIFAKKFGKKYLAFLTHAKNDSFGNWALKRRHIY
jgi:hypothetical protein